MACGTKTAWSASTPTPKSHDARPPLGAKNPGYLVYRHHYGGMYPRIHRYYKKTSPLPEPKTQRENAEHANTSTYTSTAFAPPSKLTAQYEYPPAKRQGRRGGQMPLALPHSATRHITDLLPPTGLPPQQGNQMLAKGHSKGEKSKKVNISPTPSAMLFSFPAVQYPFLLACLPQQPPPPPPRPHLSL